MSDAISESLHHYAERFSSPEPEFLRRINQETHLNVPRAHMISGHLQGRFLSMISRLVNPTNILEIGTFTGYSALCLAEGLQTGGVLHTIDSDQQLADPCKQTFQESGMGEKIILHIGNALEIIPTLSGPFDLVFIDADKSNYSRYFDLVIDKVRKNGVILADNVLFHGEVILPPGKQGKLVKYIEAFNKKISEDNRIDKVIVTLRDGLFLMIKK